VRVIGLSLFTKVFEYQLGVLLFRLNIEFLLGKLGNKALCDEGNYEK